MNSALRSCFFTMVVSAILFLPLSSQSQVTKVMGTIRDALTREALPFVNLIIPGTMAGTLTDFEGRYAFETKVSGDSLRASLMGYGTVTRKLQRNQFQVIDFDLTPSQISLAEVTIMYKGNPAEVILNKVIRNKDRNNIQSFDTYQYESYVKMELDANNISEKLRTSKLLKSFSFVFNYIDTSTVNGKSFLPVFIAEAISEIYFRKSPRSRKEIIKASRVSGLENQDLSQLLGNLSQELNVYNNYVPLFQKNFISPIADFGINHYTYYLVDSLYIGNNWCYHIMFKPRHKQELTFTGNLWITDTAFAVRKIEMKIAGDANINFINDLVLEQEYEWTDGKFWMLTKDDVLADFNVINDARKVLGFFGHRAAIYRNFKFNVPEDKSFRASTGNIYVEPDAMEKDEKFWISGRPETLTRKEQGVYNMVDSVKSIPVFKTYIDILKAVFSGYVNWGKFELGPFYRTYSFNGVEGSRFRFGGRTGKKFSKKMQLQAFIAYGTRDKRFKYGADFLYIFDKNPRKALSLSFKYDVEQLGASAKAINTDNILASLFHRGPNNKLTTVRAYDASYEHEWFTGLITTFGLSHRQLFPLGETEFLVYPKPGFAADSMKSIFTTEAQLDIRLAFRERFVIGAYKRITIKSKYPIIQLSFAYGFKNVFRSDFEYQKLGLVVRQWFNFANIGWSKYIIETGKVWGKLPYPLLKIHEGNQTFFFDEYASNLMNYYEFVSDTYISAYYTHHFDGLLFNRLPLVRKLKWREVAYIRGVYGTLSSENKSFSKFPGQMRSMGKEIYWETGVGIENIFRFFRIDAIWRLTHLHDVPNRNVPKFGIFVSANFTF